MANVNITSFTVNVSPSLSAYVVGHFGDAVGAEQKWTHTVLRALYTAALTSANISDFNAAASAAAPVQSVAGLTGAVNTIPYANISGTPTIPDAIFFRVAVSGQDNVDAATATDVLTVAAGGNVTVTTNATTKTLTIAASGGGGLADPGSNGIVVRTAANVTTARTIEGGNGVTITNGNGVSANPSVSVANASTTVLGIVELATDGQTDAGVAVQGNDARLADARTPTAHATTHVTGGSDKIRDATASVDGLMTAAFATKLDGIPANATNNAGTVTSVNGDGSTTGLTLSGGPITGSGTLTLGGILVVSNGGTGANTHTANAVLIGNGTSALGSVAPGTSANVLTSDGTNWSSQAPAGGGSGTLTYAYFAPQMNQPPSANFATLDTRGNVAVLDFDDTTEEAAIFVAVVPNAASLGSGLIVNIHWSATTATTGDCRWGAQFQRLNTDIDADSFGDATEGTTTTSGTSGTPVITSLAVSNIDGSVAGDAYRLRIYRDTGDAADNMAGDSELIAIEVKGS